MSGRKRGVSVKVLDLERLLDHVLTEAREKIRPNIHGIEIHGRLAIATDANGTTHLLCDEGVGWDLDDDPVKIPVFETFPDRRMHLVPLVEANLTTSAVADLPTTDEDLADFIRTFGTRLEGNFYEWYEILANTNTNTDAECPYCRTEMVPPAPAGEPGDDSWYCRHCGRAWSLDLKRLLL